MKCCCYGKIVPVKVKINMLPYSYCAKTSKSISLKMKLFLLVDTIKSCFYGGHSFTHFKTFRALVLEATSQMRAARMPISPKRIIEGTYGDYLAQTPTQSVSHSIRLFGALLSWALNDSKARDFPTSLGPAPEFDCLHGESIFPCM